MAVFKTRSQFGNYWVMLQIRQVQVSPWCLFSTESGSGSLQSTDEPAGDIMCSPCHFPSIQLRTAFSLVATPHTVKHLELKL